MKSLLKGLGFSLVGTAIALCVAEFVTRGLLTKQNAATWNDRPNYYYIHQESKDLRDVPHSAVKPAGSFRIAVVGDSYAFAPYMQFDDTFAKKLERMLNLNSEQPQVEVINYGVPRYSTSHEVALVKKAIAAQADLVLLQVTLNDPEIKAYRPTSLIAGEINRFGNVEFKDGILAHWKFPAFVLQRLYNLKSRQKYVDYYFNLYDQKATWKSYTTSTLRIKKLCADAGVKLNAVIFPLFGLPLDQSYPFEPLHQRIRNFMQSNQIPYSDLLSTFEGLPPERIQVIPGHDFHPNEIGHRIAAEAILHYLVQENVLPDSVIPNAVFAERIGIVRPVQTAAWR